MPVQLRFAADSRARHSSTAAGTACETSAHAHVPQRLHGGGGSGATDQRSEGRTQLVRRECLDGDCWEDAVGGAMDRGALSLSSRGSAFCPPAPLPDAPDCKVRVLRSYSTCNGCVLAVWPGCRMGWPIEASPTCATATPATAGQAVRVQGGGSQRPTADGRLNEECCCAALPCSAA